MKALHVVALVAIPLLLTYGASAAPQYNIAPIPLPAGMPQGAFLSPTAMSQNGQVVGFAETPDGSWSQPFLYSGGHTSLLNGGTGPLSGVTGFTPVGINSAGQIIGNKYIDPFTQEASMYVNGQVTSIAPAGAVNSYVSSINEAGQIVGNFLTTMNPPAGSAFIYNQGSFSYVSSGAFLGINNVGQCRGVANDGSGFLYSITTGQWSVQPPAIYYGGHAQGVDAAAINDKGDLLWVAGESEGSLMSCGIYMTQSDGTFVTIEPVSQAIVVLPDVAMNNNRQVVGAGPMAFLYDGGTVYDLRSLITNLPAGDEVTSVCGINDSGEIAGIIRDANGNQTGFVTAPEPATMALLAIGGVSLLIRRRRRSV